MKDEYKIDNIIENINKDNHSPFLDRQDLKRVVSKLKKGSYNIFEMFEDCDYSIVYKQSLPDVVLIKIICKTSLRHSDILGAIMSLGITSGVVGDIVLFNGGYYFYTLKKHLNIFLNNLSSIASSSVKLELVDLNTLSLFKRKFEENEIIVSSLRVDTVVARILNIGREDVSNKIKNKEIMLNHQILSKTSLLLKDGDVFSVRRCGKFKFVGIIKTTKKDNFIIKYLKYV